MSDYDDSIKQWISKMDSGFVGVDLDATIAVYDGWYGPLHIGEPIPAMVKIVQGLLAQGTAVKIFTARMSEPDPMIREQIAKAIGDWTEVHVGTRLPATNIKDYNMIAFYDDRAVQVHPNLGVLVEDHCSFCCGDLDCPVCLDEEE